MITHTRVARTAAALATSAALSVAVAACGSSSSSSSSTSSSAGTPAPATTTASTGAGGGGQAEAQAIVAKLTKPVPFSVTPLSKTPPKGKTVVEVNCTLPICVNGAPKAPTQKLGWKYINESFDISKGPPAYAQALTRALQDKPDYIVAVGIFPPATVKPQLAKIKAAGISISQITGLANDPAIKACVNCASYLGHDGEIQADQIVASVGTKAATLDVGDPSVVGTGQSDAGLFSEFKRLGAKAPDKLQISINKPPAVNSAAVVSYLQSHPQTKAVETTFNDALVTLPGALARAGMTGKVQFYGNSPKPADIQAMKAGTMTGNTVIESAAAWWRGVDAFARMSVGDPVKHDPSEWFALSNKQNIDAVLAASGGQPEPPAFQDAYAKAWKVG